MKRTSLSIICTLLIIALLGGCNSRDALQSSADFLIKSAGEPQTGTPGGDWTVFATARSGKLPDGWGKDYHNALNASLSNGELRRATDFSRATLALRAMGEAPDNKLLEPLWDAEAVAAQGSVSLAYALLALGADADADLQKQLLEKLLEYQLPAGGFAPPDVSTVDSDVTAIALQALAHTPRTAEIQSIIDTSLDALSGVQTPDGSFTGFGAASAESTAQVVIALCELGISPEGDSRFTKDKSVLDALSSFAVSGGGFSHVAGGKADVFATEQALCALEAMRRLENGEPSLFDFSDVGAQTCSLTVKTPEGTIYENSTVQFANGETVFDLLKRELKSAGVHLEFTTAPAINVVYIEGIDNLYEFDRGENSGWLYSVNGEYPNFSSSQYKPKSGDVVVFEYVTDKPDAFS